MSRRRTFYCIAGEGGRECLRRLREHFKTRSIIQLREGVRQAAARTAVSLPMATHTGRFMRQALQSVAHSAVGKQR